MEQKKLMMVEAIKMFFTEHGRFPKISELKPLLGFTRKNVRLCFGTYGDLIESALNTIDEPIFTDQRVDALNHTISKNSTFFITTAVVGAPLFENGYNSINTFCKEKKAELLVIPSADPAAKISSGLDKRLLNGNLVISNVDLNENIAINALKVSAKQINPTTGLGRMGQRNKSFIFASPKQSLEFVPVANNKMPHALMTTGSITVPQYETDKYMSMRTAAIAFHDHILGGVIVEVVDNKIYHFRHVEFSVDGSFVDIGVRYHPDGKTSKAKVLGMVLGDWHCGATNQDVSRCTFEMIKMFSPEKIVLHDVFNGLSVNHHIFDKIITKARMPQISLEQELKILRNDIEKFSHCCKEVAIVKSNHDEWVDRYLEDGRFIKDPLNLRKALELAISLYDGEDPLECGIGKIKNVKFLKRDEDYIIGDTQCGSHGDIEGSLIRLEKSFGKSISGHSHTAAKLRRVTKVGTSTNLREDYAKGPISWTNTHAIIYDDNTTQLINIIDKKWKK